MAPYVMPSRRTLRTCCGALRMFPTIQTPNRPRTIHVATLLTCLVNRGSAASIGRRAVCTRVVTGGALRSSPCLVEGLHQAGRRRQHLVGDELAALRDVNRHGSLVGVAVLVDVEVAEHAVGDVHAEQVLGDVGPRAVRGLDGV